MNTNILFYNVLLCITFSTVLCLQNYTFAITPCDPMIVCNIGDEFSGLDLLDDDITSKIRGYEIDLIKFISYLNNWELTQWKLVCQDYASVFESVQNGTATLGFGGIPVSAESLYKGFEFSLPTYYTGLRLISRIWPDKNIWILFVSFDLYLWLVIFATTLFIGIITWILEDQTFQWRKNKDRCITNVKEMIWQAFSGLFFASEVRLQRFPARIVWLCFWFMILILTAAYNADLTTKMSTNTFALKFSSLNDAGRIGAKIATLQHYEKLISGYNLKNPIVKSYDLESLNEIQQMFIMGEIDGLVLDTAATSKLNSRFPCSSTVFQTTIIAFNYGIIYSGSVDSTYRKNIDTSILQIKESRELQDVLNQNVMVASEDQTCTNSTPKLTLRRLGGLWVIFAVTVGIAIIIDRINAFLDRKRGNMQMGKKKRVEEMDADEKKFVLDSYLMTTDYIHIPSKDLHLQLEEDIKSSLDHVEQTLKDKFNHMEKKVVDILNSHKTQEMLYGGSTSEIVSPDPMSPGNCSPRKFDFNLEGKLKID